MTSGAADRRARAEAARRRLERELRPEGPREEDRDRGLESAWRRRLAGERIASDGGVLWLEADGAYRAEFPDGPESGTWRVTSCVGRASLLLSPRGAGDYGWVLSRVGEGVALNAHAARGG